MLQLKNVNITINKTDRLLISDFSFSLESGDKAAIIGEEGNGKSTLLKLMAGDNSFSDYASFSGNVVRRGVFGYLPQFMPEKYSKLTVSEYLGDTDIYGKTDVIDKLNLFGFVNSERIISTLSGGEKIKVQLLKLLCDGADALFLDEPSNDLDIASLMFLQDFISECPVPVVFISHDETLIRETANLIIHVEQLIKKTSCKVTVARLSYDDYLSSRGQLFERQTRIAQKERSEYKKQYDKWQRIFERVQYEQNVISRGNPAGGRLLKKKMKSVLSQKAHLEREREEFTEIPDREKCIITEFDKKIFLPPQKVITFDIPCLSAGEEVKIRDIKLSLFGGEHICIIGDNGVGKSTLLRKLFEELKLRSDLTAEYMPQNYGEILDFNKTPIEYFESYDKETLTRAKTFMGNMKFTPDEMNLPMGKLSGGQCAKIIFLNMVLKGANVLVLDEPTRNFSPLSAPVIRNAIRSFGGSVISVSHDRNFIADADKVYLLTRDGLKLIKS